MAMLNRVVALRGIDIELSVREEREGFYGAWFCKSCWRGGTRYDFKGTIQQAEQQALEMAEMHLETKHTDSPPHC